MCIRDSLRRPQDRSSAFLRGILSKSACVDCKYAAILAVAFHPVKMQAIWPAAVLGAPSGRPRTTSKQKTAFQKSLSTSKAFFLNFSALNDVVTRHRKYAANLLGEPLRSNLCFSDFWQKCAQVLFCTFRRCHGTP